MTWNDIGDLFKQMGVRLLYGLLVLVVGFFLIHWLYRLLEEKLPIKHMEPTVATFLRNFSRVALSIIVILTAANVMGVPLTSFVTILASAGVAVSLALQGALSNLIGGLILLILKPIKVGDYVKIGDLDGTVKAVGVIYTELLTPDNRHISMPNSSLTNTAIINYTRQGTRRLDVPFSVSYEADIGRVKEILFKVLSANAAILPDPAPAVLFTEMADSSLNFVVRVWCKSKDYWDINFYLLEEGKRALDQASISIPYPQMDVHIRQN